MMTKTTKTTATVTVHPRPAPSRYYPADEQERNGATPCGSPIDGWCSPGLVSWLQHTLTDRSARAVTQSLAAGVGTEDVEIETEVRA